MNIQPNIFNRINSFDEYQKKMADYENQIVKMMIGKEGQHYVWSRKCYFDNDLLFCFYD